MTTTAVATFALRFQCPVIPIHVVRLGPARFSVICEPPMEIPDTGDSQTDIYTKTEAINATLERWIRKQPGAWLWLHRRCPKQPSTDLDMVETHSGPPRDDGSDGDG